MKVKHIITTCGVIAGGMVMAQGASAVVTYVGESDVQFTFSSVLSLSVSGDFAIADLAPGASDMSDDVTVTVDTNSSSGYTLSATVGNGTYNTSELVRDSDNKIAMISSSATTLSSGTWGYTLNSGTSYGALDTEVPKILNKTTNSAGTAASGYGGTKNTNVKIGAYASSTQRSGDYKNVVNFTATPNIALRTINVVAGDNVASVTPSSASAYDEGYNLAISATCSSGYTFSNWVMSGDYGSLADATNASTTYTVGGRDNTLTAYCK